MNSCCCAHCRDLGFFGFELLRELTSLLARAVNGGSLPAWCDEKKLLARIDEEERFHSSQFAAHQSEASSTAEHCRRHLLSTLSDERFRCACTHGRADGGDVPELEMHEERIRRTQHRAANSTTDWESTCMICADGDEDEEKTGRMYCCAHCRSVIHKKCGIKKIGGTSRLMTTRRNGSARCAPTLSLHSDTTRGASSARACLFYCATSRRSLTSLCINRRALRTRSCRHGYASRSLMPPTF